VVVADAIKLNAVTCGDRAIRRPCNRLVRLAYPKQTTGT
jgi:hypothetical protein